MTLMLTPEAPDPATQRTLAGRGARLAAALIDAALAAIGLFLPLVVRSLWLLVLVAINLWGLALHGQSIGKFLLKITIVDPETNLPPGYMRTAVIRSGPQAVLSTFAPRVSPLLLAVDALFIFSKTRQCLHDRLARTVVIVGTREWW